MKYDSEPFGARDQFHKDHLTEEMVEPHAIAQFSNWFKVAMDREVVQASACHLATLDANGFPGTRVVYMRSFDEDGFVFYTNYLSDKGQSLANHPKACLNFFWPELERQVRITGTVAKVSAEKSDDYFSRRPRESQIGAWASAQSEVIANREELEKKLEKYTAGFEGQTVQRPPHWGGYVLAPLTIEFWQGRPSRLHDRLRYTLKDGNWVIERLSP